MGKQDGGFEVDVQGVSMPAWLMSVPSAVVDVTIGEKVITFEQLFSTTTYTCTWPRYASMITRPDPARECGFRLDDYNEDAFTAHALTHIETCHEQ